MHIDITESKWEKHWVKNVFFPLQHLLQEVKQLKQKVEELEGEKDQYERKLRGTKVLVKSTC